MSTTYNKVSGTYPDPELDIEQYMTKNDTGTLCVRFIPDINDAYPLSIIIVDDRNNQVYLQVRQNDIDALLACLWTPMSPAIRLVTMMGDRTVKWWNNRELAIINRGTHHATVLHWREAMELYTMVRHEMACPSAISESDPLAGATKRRDENLRGAFT